LCIKRDFEPEQGKWSLMGGFLEENESINEAAERVLFNLTGLKDIYLEQLQSYGDTGRDSAGRVISIAYYALIDSVKFDKQISKDIDAQWFALNKLPDLIFDHQEMVLKAMKRLRRRCRFQPIGFELLPKKFTLPQLQNLYEEIFGTEFDKRNFRKRILYLGILNKLEEKDKLGSKKGAFYYKFDKKRYNELMDNGFNFEI
ncbi:MAG: NUDIX domain-containing protein, partial [Bacteroidales bacterium]|nr:NUDIX domain-containing protein [Bacteroidales bacterium]